MSTYGPKFAAPVAYVLAASLASPSYDLTGTVYNSSASNAVDVVLEYAATVAATPTGNKQIALFVQASLDGTTWAPLPSSATDTTRDTSMRPLGQIPCNNGGSPGPASDRFSIAAAFGFLPPYWRVIVKNDCGVALSACSARTLEISLAAV
jgi:hypothetical protein